MIGFSTLYRDIPPNVRSFAHNLAGQQDGAVLVYVAVMMPFLLGAAGLGIDVSMWYAQKRLSQNAADAAAMAGAYELLRSDGQDLQQATDDGASLHGFSTANGDIISVYWPPANGPFAGDDTRVEVIVARPAPLVFAPAVFSKAFEIEARAVAGISYAAEGCVVALNDSAPSAVRTHGTGDVTLDCAVYSNSSDPDAIDQVGSSCLTANGIFAVGGASGSCLSPAPVTGVSHYADPLEDLPEPTFAGCDVNGKTKINGDDNVTLSPGTYCGNIEISAAAHFEPGLYYLRNSALSLNAGAVVTGSDVTFFFNDSGSSNDSFTMNGQADVTLSAPTDVNDPYEGILIYQSRDVDHNMIHKINGGASTELEGTIYTPGAEVQFNGGSQTTVWNVLVVADTVDMGGNTEIAGYEFADGSQMSIGNTVALYE